MLLRRRKRRRADKDGGVHIIYCAYLWSKTPFPVQSIVVWPDQTHNLSDPLIFFWAQPNQPPSKLLLSFAHEYLSPFRLSVPRPQPRYTQRADRVQLASPLIPRLKPTDGPRRISHTSCINQTPTRHNKEQQDLSALSDVRSSLPRMFCAPSEETSIHKSQQSTRARTQAHVYTRPRAHPRYTRHLRPLPRSCVSSSLRSACTSEPLNLRVSRRVPPASCSAVFALPVFSRPPPCPGCLANANRRATKSPFRTLSSPCQATMSAPTARRATQVCPPAVHVALLPLCGFVTPILSCAIANSPPSVGIVECKHVLHPTAVRRRRPLERDHTATVVLAALFSFLSLTYANPPPVRTHSLASFSACDALRSIANWVHTCPKSNP